MFQGLFLVAMGGAVGAVSRAALCVVLERCAGRVFPWGTLAVNLIGGLAIGILAGQARTHPFISLGLITGLLGGFTTFSAFSLDTVALAERGALTTAATNVLANVSLTLLATWVGGRLSVLVR